MQSLYLSSKKDDRWMKDAACKGSNPEIFFPERGASTKEAKQVCDKCSVVTECLVYALTSPMEKNGIWGRKTGRERRRLRL